MNKNFHTQPVILGLISEKGGGKSTVASYLQKYYHAKVLRFSFFIEEMLESLELPTKNRDIQIKFIEKLRQLLSEDILAKIIVRHIYSLKQSKKLIILDGVRFPSEEKYLKKHLKNFFTIAITADPKTRYLRTKKRGEKSNESTFSYTQFLKEHNRSTEKNINNLMKNADFSVDNTKDLNYLYTQIDTIMQKIYGNKKK